MRSLLYQLLKEIPEIAAKTQTTTDFAINVEEVHKAKHDESKLLEILKSTLRASPSPILLFLDGLDEYAGPGIELLNLLDDLMATGCKICVASRPEPLLCNKLEGRPTIQMETQNRAGIAAFSFEVLRRSLPRRAEENIESLQVLSHHIACKSEGVFLWADLALNELLEEGPKNPRASDLEDILSELPPQLHDMYSRIVDRFKGQRRTICGVLLRLSTSAKRYLHITELYQALCLLGLYKAPSSSAKVSRGDLLRFESFLTSTTRGLLEIVSQGADDVLEAGNDGDAQAGQEIDTDDDDLADRYRDDGDREIEMTATTKSRQGHSRLSLRTTMPLSTVWQNPYSQCFTNPGARHRRDWRTRMQWNTNTCLNRAWLPFTKAGLNLSPRQKRQKTLSAAAMVPMDIDLRW